jgi:ABC-type nitrate/sulfonate/bicarbonate transport system permease component
MASHTSIGKGTARRVWPAVPPQVAGLFLLAALLALVEVGVRTDFISSTVVARPSEAIAGLVTVQNRVDLRDAFFITFATTAVAMMLELLVALPLGYLLFQRRDLSQAYSSWLAALLAAPIFLLYPLFMVIFGRNEVTLVIMGFLPGVIPLIIQVEQGLRGVPQTLLNVGQSVGVTAWQNFFKIMLPAAAPTVFTGFRMALIYTIINIIAIEYLVDIGGLGRIVADRYFRFDIAGTYTAILAVTAISILFNWLINRVERWVRPS